MPRMGQFNHPYDNSRGRFIHGFAQATEIADAANRMDDDPRLGGKLHSICAIRW